MTLELNLHDRVTDVDRAAWQTLSVNPYESYGWFTAMEEHFAETRFLYFCAVENGQLRAVLPAYDRHAPNAPDSITKLALRSGKRFEQLGNRLLRRAPLRFLIAGSPHSYVSDVIGDPSCDEFLIDAIERHALEHDVDLLSLPFMRRRITITNAFTTPCVEDHQLDLPGTSVDDYCASFSSKKSRYTRRKEFRAAPKFTERPLAGHGKTVSELGYVTAQRHGVSDPVAPDLYESLARHLGDDARVLLAGEGEDYRGALAFLTGPDSLNVFHIGVLERDETYFHICFTNPIRIAYEQGHKQINLRPSSDRAKRIRGCRVIPTTFYCAPTSSRGRVTMALLDLVRRVSGGETRARDV